MRLSSRACPFELRMPSVCDLHLNRVVPKAPRIPPALWRLTWWAVVTITGLSIHTELKEQEAILDDLENRTDYAVHNMDDVNRLVICPHTHTHTHTHTNTHVPSYDLARPRERGQR